MADRNGELGDYFERFVRLSSNGSTPSTKELSDDLVISERSVERRARDLHWLGVHARLGKSYEHTVFDSGDTKGIRLRVCTHLELLGPKGTEWTPISLVACEQRDLQERERYARWLSERTTGNPMPEVPA